MRSKSYCKKGKEEGSVEEDRVKNLKEKKNNSHRSRLKYYFDTPASPYRNINNDDINDIVLDDMSSDESTAEEEIQYPDNEAPKDLGFYL